MPRLILAFLLLLAALPVHAKKLKLYDGPERDRKELATYSLWNFPGFFGDFQIYTVSFDERNFELVESGTLVPATGGYALIAPGPHKVRVSFTDRDHGIFLGWFELEFVAEAGRTYAPIFDMSLPKESFATRMCIGSSRKTGGPALAEIRLKGHAYLACAAPRLDMAASPEEFCASETTRAIRPAVCRLEALKKEQEGDE